MIKKAYKNHKETIHNFIWRFLQILGQNGITFLILIFCARLLEPYTFGIYNYVLAIIFFLIIFGDFGISTATSKYVAEYNATDKKKLKLVLFNSGIIILALTVIITILTLLFGKFFLGDKYVYVLYVLPLIFLAPMTSLYDGVYRGLKQFKKLAVISIIVGLISLSFVYILIKQYGLVGALISQNLFYLILLIALGLGYGRFSLKWDRKIMKEVSKYSFTYGIAILGNYLFIRFGTLILGYHNYLTQIATYELLNKVSMILVIPFTILGQVVAPNFTQLNAKKEYSKIYSKLKEYTLYFFFIGLLMGGILYLVFPQLIRLYLPKYYNSLFFQILPFTVIIFITNVWAATIDAGILVPTGYANLMARFYIPLGIFGVILSIVLVNLVGYMGVVYSFTACSILMVLGLRIMYFIKIKK